MTIWSNTDTLKFTFSRSHLVLLKSNSPALLISNFCVPYWFLGQILNIIVGFFQSTFLTLLQLNTNAIESSQLNSFILVFQCCFLATCPNLVILTERCSPWFSRGAFLAIFKMKIQNSVLYCYFSEKMMNNGSKVENLEPSKVLLLLSNAGP